MITLSEELEYKMSEEDFWNDPENAQSVLKKAKGYRDTIEEYNQLHVDHEDLEMMISFIEDGDESFQKDLLKGLEALENRVREIKIATLLKGEYDKNNAIISIHAGTGGLDAQDWAKMLLRMYTRWAEDKGYGVKTLDILTDTEAGIKSVTLLIEGMNAYGYLKAEKGVHRLVRISPFDSSGKRHTSFASVDVMPEIDDSVDIQINPNDLRIDTYRASGSGGQHVNKTDSAVRITHIPTGIVVQCQNERSQHSNRETAMKMLISKLIEVKETEQKEKIEDLQGEYNQIAWGSQIRSYVFNPYNLVKDHRTNVEMGNIQAVMDGEIDEFINGYLKGSLDNTV
ncbi:peptide chain release factor 2 [Alkaliphilus oremlandii OhILAs]|uniref:Peptide chain release factor 2 n=1 Tax=Alkaliphilus oremlandii (strain OhILAs) TaxID=350688 RepID=A8MJN4_ALKOO|nr:peptide chain release factor 2 [Alkaliphilus oremlandii OhILAs]